MPTLTGKKCINFFNEAYEYNKTKKYLYRLPRSESFCFPSRLPSAFVVAWETCLAGVTAARRFDPLHALLP